jgi:Choline/ethanolamine kinase
VSSPLTSSRTLLLRLYGATSSSLISRRRELCVLHALSSKYKLGPRIYGTFTNGRVEEYFDSVALTAREMREPQISKYIGARMAELHSVDLAIIEGSSRGGKVEIGVRKNVQSWLPHARDVVALPGITPTIRKELDLDTFQTKWERYMKWLIKDSQVGSRPVFCHNDAQYGNILHLNSAKGVTPEHHQVRPSLAFLFIVTNFDRFFYVHFTVNRSSLSILSTLLQTQPPSTSRTTSTNGRPTTTVRLPTYLTRHVIRAPPNAARSSPPTSRTARHHRMLQPS